MSNKQKNLAYLKKYDIDSKHLKQGLIQAQESLKSLLSYNSISQDRSYYKLIDGKIISCRRLLKHLESLQIQNGLKNLIKQGQNSKPMSEKQFKKEIGL